MNTDSHNFYFLHHGQVALVLILLGLLVFSFTTYSLLSQSLLYNTDHDLQPRMEKIHDKAQPWLVTTTDILNKFGNIGSGIIGTLLGLYWLVKKRWYQFALMLGGPLGNFILFMSMAYLFNRQRPHPFTLFGLTSLPGYPSGHVMAVVGLYGVLLYLALPDVRSAVGQVALAIATILLVLVVGFLRLYVSAHWLSDVIAAYGLGLAWTVFAITAIEWLFVRRGWAAT